MFREISHTSTASSLAQQNIVADFGDQQMSKTGFYTIRKELVTSFQSFNEDLSRCKCNTWLISSNYPKWYSPIRRWWKKHTFSQRTPSQTINWTLNTKENQWQIENADKTISITECPAYVFKYCSLLVNEHSWIRPSSVPHKYL